MSRKLRKWLILMEPASGIEPPTYGLRNRCSTTELRRLTTKFEQ